MRYLLDTNVLTEGAKPAPDPTVVAWLRGRPTLDLAISVLTLGEIAKGVALVSTGKRRTALERWVATELPRQFLDRVLPVDADVSLAWGRMAAAGRREGRELPVIDGLLLASAAVHDLTFVTRNERDCSGRGVEILNPWRTG